MEGGNRDFLKLNSNLMLRKIYWFWFAENQGREADLHCHLEEGLALGWVIKQKRGEL